MTEAVLALGANLGDRVGTLTQAIDDLEAIPGVRVGAVSDFYESVAITLSGPDPVAPSYLNAVLLVQTEREPSALLDATSRIEDAHGRVRAERWGSRTLDIDIVDYGGRELRTPRLELPHPRAAERSFVVIPWLQIDPDAVLPGYGRVADLPSAGLAAELSSVGRAAGWPSAGQGRAGG